MKSASSLSSGEHDSSSKYVRRSTFSIFKRRFKLMGPQSDAEVRTKICPHCADTDPVTPHESKCPQPKIGFLVDGEHFRVKDGNLTPGPCEVAASWYFGSVLDPRSHAVQRWNRAFLVSCAVSTAIDPLFLYILSVNKDLTCLFIEKGLAIAVTILRAITDLIYFLHMYLQLRLAYVSRKTLVQGRGELVWDARRIAIHYLGIKGAFWFDIITFFPLLPVMVWYLIPNMINKGYQTPNITAMVLVTFLVQYIPKVAHMVNLIQRMQDVTGYIFGTAWGGFAMNVTAFFVSAHVAGACWYLLAIQQVQTCLYLRCKDTQGCNTRWLGCPLPISGGYQPMNDEGWVHWGEDEYIIGSCMSSSGDYDFGIYQWAVSLVLEHTWLERIMYPIFFGIMTLSTFGNALTPSNRLVEILFSICMVTSGLLLFSMLIGNIQMSQVISQPQEELANPRYCMQVNCAQMFLHSVIAKKEDMQLRVRDLEWWMHRRQIPQDIQHRVRRYERQRWAALRGIDEETIINDMPEGLRRDVQRHLCVDLVKQVPLFQTMEELVLDNICERLKPQLFMKGELVYCEGEPVSKMVFICRGHLESSYKLNNNQTSVCILAPGHFCGDELLSWALRRPFVERLPPSTATLRSLDSCEVFALRSQDLSYIIDHFRAKFENEDLKRLVRFYSPSWRMWAAVTMQLGWRRYKAKRAIAPFNLGPNNIEILTQPNIRGSARSTDLKDGNVNLITSMLISPKPQEQ